MSRAPSVFSDARQVGHGIRVITIPNEFNILFTDHAAAFGCLSPAAFAVRFAMDTICPAVRTPIAKPMIKVPNNKAAFGIVTVRNSKFVSTACVFCNTTIKTNKLVTAMATDFTLLSVPLNMFHSESRKGLEVS